jgi:iron complex outermembrane recepter protein
MRHQIRIILSSAAATIALALSSAALAQPADAASATSEAEAATDAAADSGEIVVTAQKRSESVQRIPASITALGGEALSQRGITSAADLQFAAPSMQTGKILGNTAVNIRGVGLNQGSPGVAIHVDGVYQAQPTMGDLAQADLERVEILRGPQGTLYGRNATGGAINFITKAPTDRFEGYALAGYAEYDESKLQGMINLPLGDRVRARLVADWTRRGDGFVKNVTPGGPDLDKGETLSGRLRIAVDLADNLTLDLSGAALHGSGPSLYFTLHNAPSASAIAMNPYLVNAIVPLDPWRTSANGPITSDRDYVSGGATLTWNIGDATVKSITGYAKNDGKYVGDDDATQLDAFPVFRHFASKTFTQELNVSGEMGPVRAVGGLFYLADNNFYLQEYNFKLGIFPLPPGTILHFEANNNNTRSKAAFADLTVDLTDRFRLIGGIRLSKDTQRIEQNNYFQTNVGGTTQPRTSTCPVPSNEVSWSSTTPRIGAQFDLASNANVYATFSKGFKAGGFNAFACDNVFNPEKVTAYEGGIKSRLFDNMLTLNASAFYYDYTNLQISQVIGLSRIITNAAGARVKGFEVEATLQPDDNWTINGNMSVLDAEYSNFSNVDSLNTALGVQNLKGNRLNNAPKFSGNLGIAYRTDALSFGRITARTDLSYRSTQYFREFNTALDSQPGYALLNLSLIWDSPDDNYRVRLYANNVTNKAVIGQLQSSDQFGARYVTWGAPRQIGAEVRAKF